MVVSGELVAARPPYERALAGPVSRHLRQVDPQPRQAIQGRRLLASCRRGPCGRPRL